MGKLGYFMLFVVAAAGVEAIDGWWVSHVEYSTRVWCDSCAFMVGIGVGYLWNRWQARKARPQQDATLRGQVNARLRMFDHLPLVMTGQTMECANHCGNRVSVDSADSCCSDRCLMEVVSQRA